MVGPEHFRIESKDDESFDLGEGEILIQLIALSADPYLRGAIKSTGFLRANSVMSGFVVGKVVQSNSNENWVVGDLFGGQLPFSTIQVVTQAKASSPTNMWKLTGLISEENISLGLGVLGMPGATAYGGLIDVLRPIEGETIFISAASGAVGSLVGMIAKNVYGCKVIGSCGGPDKCRLIKDKFNFDHAIDYKTVTTADQLKAALLQAAPQGIDMYFEVLA